MTAAAEETDATTEERSSSDTRQYAAGYLDAYKALDLASIKQLAAAETAAAEALLEPASSGGSEAAKAEAEVEAGAEVEAEVGVETEVCAEFLTFDEFSTAAAHFPILGLGATLLLEALNPQVRCVCH
eukprot:COSAG06_NODE_31_length_31488_cov_60.882793_28_plen_128_part_00